MYYSISYSDLKILTVQTFEGMNTFFSKKAYKAF